MKERGGDGNEKRSQGREAQEGGASGALDACLPKSPVQLAVWVDLHACPCASMCLLQTHTSTHMSTLMHKQLHAHKHTCTHKRTHAHTQKHTRVQPPTCIGGLQILAAKRLQPS